MTRTADRGPHNPAPALDTVLSAVRVVLYEPQDPVNIAATIRAMKNMGCGNLYLVRSVEYDPWRLEGIAHDTGDIIDRIRNCSTIDLASRNSCAPWPPAPPKPVAPWKPPCAAWP